MLVPKLGVANINSFTGPGMECYTEVHCWLTPNIQFACAHLHVDTWMKTGIERVIWSCCSRTQRSEDFQSMSPGFSI